jgi:predicted negative regulator of RcsB-dependent stress response
VSEYLSEKEQWEQIRLWVRENGLWIVAGLAIGAAVLGGWRWWQSYRDARGVAASARYTQMIQALESGDQAMAFVRLGELERDYGDTPYADQGKLIAARVYVEGGQLDKAAYELETVMRNSRDRDLALVARARLARVEVAQGKSDAALATLDAVQPGAFAARYHEARGEAYEAKGDKAAALREYRAAVSDGGLADTSLIDLKIADLAALPEAGGAAGAAAGSPSATAPAAGPAPAVAPAAGTAK